MRVVDSRDCSGLVTVWRPGQVWMDMEEGRWVGLTGAQVNRVQGHTVHLTMGRQAQTEEIPNSLDRPQTVSTTRTVFGVQAVCQAGFRPQFHELDLVAVVLDVGQARVGPPSFQTVILVDQSLCCVKLLVWGGVAAAGVQDLLQPGQVVSCKNLEWRDSSSCGPVPSIYLTEYSVVSAQPRDQDHAQAVRQLAAAVKTSQLMDQARQRLKLQERTRQEKYNPRHTSAALRWIY